MLKQRTHGISWPLRYFFGRRSDQWYSKLFTGAEGIIQGDCTPAYSILEEQAVARIYKIMPKTNIIFILRDPVDRSWSHAKLDLGRRSGRALDSIKDEDYIAHSLQMESLLRSDYIRTFDIWRKFFPVEQIKIVFFDDLKQNPDEYIQDIYAFLGIEDLTMEQGSEQKKAVNESGSYSMPMAVRKHLCRYYLDKMAHLSSRFGGHATAWYQKAEAFLDSIGQQEESTDIKSENV